MNEKLKPCPYCQKLDKVGIESYSTVKPSGFVVGCVRCCLFLADSRAETAEKAIEDWNKRVDEVYISIKSVDNNK